MTTTLISLDIDDISKMRQRLKCTPASHAKEHEFDEHVCQSVFGPGSEQKSEHDERRDIKHSVS